MPLKHRIETLAAQRIETSTALSVSKDCSLWRGLEVLEQRIGNSTDILLLQQRRETSTALSVSGEEYRKRSTHVTLDKLLIAQKF